MPRSGWAIRRGRSSPGAGHDAVYMSYLAPTGMIFIPCKDGISHNEIEYASPEHVAAGANVLLQVMLPVRAAGVDGRPPRRRVLQPFIMLSPG